MPLLSKKERFLRTCLAVKISGLKIPPRIVWFLQPFDKDRTHKQSMMTSAQVWQGHPRRAISVHVTLLHVLQSLCRRAWPGSGSSFVFHCKKLQHASIKMTELLFLNVYSIPYRSQSHYLSVQTTDNTHYFSKWTTFSFSCHRKVGCFYCNGFGNTTALSPLEPTVFPVN